MELLFHKNLYPRKAVDQAVEAFRETVTVQVSRKGSYWAVSFDPAEAGVSEEEAAGEFQNYVLGLTIAQRGNA